MKAFESKASISLCFILRLPLWLLCVSSVATQNVSWWLGSLSRSVNLQVKLWDLRPWRWDLACDLLKRLNQVLGWQMTNLYRVDSLSGACVCFITLPKKKLQECSRISKHHSELVEWYVIISYDMDIGYYVFCMQDGLIFRFPNEAWCLVCCMCLWIFLFS